MILVRKASGEEEQFDPHKLESSLRNAGAGDDIINEIITDITEWIYSGVPTKKIYARAFQLLKRIKGISAIRYRLKQSMLEMGPTGYPFEHFIGKIFEMQGYKVKTGQVLEGRCVTHEMDVIATGKGVQHLVECKYGQDQGKYISVQTPLYVRSRVNDIIDRYRETGKYEGFEFIVWVATNTRFSGDAVKYAECSGLKILSWDYPEGNSLREIVERERLYPVTVLTKLTIREKQQLLEKGIVTTSQLLDNLDVLDSIEFRRSRSTAVLKELNDIANLPVITHNPNRGA